MDTYPSIFNDVIGPVMRGPSSSHCAAALRIGRLARDLMAGRVDRVLAEFDRGGSLAHTHADQGSDMGLAGGLLGWDAQDERLIDAAGALEKAGIRYEVRTGDYGDAHPNTYRLTLSNAAETRRLTALSTGGGMIEVVAIDGVPLSVKGDWCETLVAVDGAGADAQALLERQAAVEEVRRHAGPDGALIEGRSRTPLPAAVLSALAALSGVRWVRALAPVLPILSRRNLRVPFLTCRDMLAWNRERRLDLAGLGAAYESARGALAEEEVLARMRTIVGLLRRSIARGVAGTRWPDRLLGVQSAGFAEAQRRGALLDAGMLNAMIHTVTALMEVKSAMGVIVAAPTAGACGGLPGAVIAAAEALGRPETETARALLAAGMVGVFIAAHATFAAEVGGCLAECGAGSGMAAAALVTLAGGDARQATDAAAMAIQNVLGLICDPVANRVEVPCLGRNVLAAANALACANMALAGYDAVIPLDEVIETMHRVGRSLPMELRCTALGGLSVTPTAQALARRLASPPA